MYKRLIIVSVIIFAGLCGVCGLGYYSIGLHAEGLAARRANEFVAVAEQIRLDVKRKLDRFIKAEEDRPYTDYQYFYVPTASNYASALVRSPLAENIQHGLAYGHFQLESDGTVVSPYNKPYEEPTDLEVKSYIENLKNNLLTTLAGNGPALKPENVPQIAKGQRADRKKETLAGISVAEEEGLIEDSGTLEGIAGKAVASKSKASAVDNRRGAYRIQSLDEPTQKTQVLSQSRANVLLNTSNVDIYDNLALQRQVQQPESRRLAGGFGGGRSYDYQAEGQSELMSRAVEQYGVSTMPDDSDSVQLRGRATKPDSLGSKADEYKAVAENKPAPTAVDQAAFADNETAQTSFDQLSKGMGLEQEEEMVQVRIEPFQPIVVGGGQGHAEFPGQVFLLRHVQIEEKHFLQGFRLDEAELIRQVEESASRYVVRRDMGFDVGCEEARRATHTAVLDFGFGDLVLNLFERKPGMIASQVANLKKGFFAIVGVVFVAVMLAQASLWRSARQQIKLARKKDDFISAVSHELRTPLTTIRMHTEMLEKGWVKSEDKRSEYYCTMRQESERLSRLIENVLDFSRIQRGRKKYNFKLGDINHCIGDVVDMMAPCALQAGFSVEKDFAEIEQFAFDSDAVMQIVINLLDNAFKYAHNADEKVICVRTASDNGYVLIEVEDHGPGVPRLQRRRVFEEFYRCGDESRREATGTGLGLALVKRFAQAHDGFVEILAARPTGAIFRVGLVAQEV